MSEADYENIIKDLRESGASQIETVRFLVKDYKLTLKDADKLVLYSKTWQDKFNSNKKVRNEFFDDLEKY